MRVSVARVEDFVERVRPAFLELLQSTTPAERSLEIELAPGDYRGASLTVGDGERPHAVDVLLRAADPRRPPVLRDTRLDVAGRTIRLERLIFADFVDQTCLLSASASQNLTIEGCAFLNNQRRGASGGGLVELAGSSPNGTRAAFRQCWFVRNLVPHGDALVWCAAEPPRFFEELRLEDVAFLDNQAMTCVLPNTTVSVVATRCIVVPSAGDRQEFVARVSPGTLESIDSSVLVRDGTAVLPELVEPCLLDAERGHVPDITRLRTALS